MALICTDWLNGYNLIEEGHVIWGLMTALLPFLPGAIVGLYAAWVFLSEKNYCNFFLNLLFFLPGVVLGTEL